jgi:hypothetical protein
LEEADKLAKMEMDPEELAAASGFPAAGQPAPGQPGQQPTPNGPPQPANSNAQATLAGNSRRRAANDRARRMLRDRAHLPSVDTTLLLTDAVPKPLYVSRKVLNGAEIVRWAEQAGFSNIVPADEMHVTITLSREPVDWLKMGEPGWNGNDGNLQVSPGGPRVVEPLGEAIVLMFSSWELAYRHGAMIEAGASWDFSDYVPHLSLTYDREANAGLDLNAVVPFAGAIQLGPEIFEPLNPEAGAAESA